MTKEAAEALEELGEETDNMITTQSKLRETIMNATKAASADGKGFDILDDNGNYKSTYEIMLGLAELYDDIVESDKELGTNNLNLLLETIAGKNRANIAASILQNPDVLKNVFNDSAINSTNSALEENEKYLESIEGHLQKFQNAVQDLFYSLLDSGIVNDVIDLGTKLINILDAIVDALGSTGSLLATGGLIVALRNLPDILSYSITNFPQLIKNIKTLSYLFSNGFSLKSTVSDLYNLSYSLETAEQQAALLGKTLKGLKGLGIAAVITAIAYAGFQLYDAYEHMGDKAKEVFEEYENNINTLKSYKDEIQSLNNTINNSSDFNEVRDARKRVLEIQNLMIDNYGLESEEVKNLTENLVDNSDAWDRLSDSQWEAAKRDFEDDTSFWEKVIMQMEGATSRTDYMLKQMESDLNDFNFMIPKEAIDDAYALADAFEDLSVLTVNGTNLLNISYDGTTEGLYSRLLEIKKLSSDIISEDSAIMDGIQGAITHYGDLIDEYGDFYNQYVLQERIYKNANYEKYYQGMAKAYDNFVEAYADGNEELVDATTDSLLEQYDSLTKALAADETLSDTEKASILGVFDDLYPDLKNKINGWRFEIHFEANTDNLKTRVEEALDMWDGNVDGSINVDAGNLADVLAGDEIPGTEDYKREAYDALKEIAAEYGYAEDEWEQFLQRLVDMGVIAAGNLVTNVEKSSSSIFNYNSLSTAVKNMSDKILPQFEALGEAYDAIFNGDKGFTLADVDTSILENIRSTFEDLDEDLGVDWDDQISAVESFLSVIGDVSSTEGEVQEAFNNLATSYFTAAVAAGDFSEGNAVVLEQMMSEMGIINAGEVSTFYRNLAEAQEQASRAGIDLTNVTAEEITKLTDEGTISQVTSQYLAYLAMVKRLTSETPVSTSSDIEQLEALAEAAGMAADYLALVARAKAIALEVEKGNTGRQAELDAYIAKLQNYSAPEIELDFGVPGDTSSASSAGEDAADAYVEAFEEELEALEKQRDAGIISEAQFLEKYKELIEKYFKDVDGYGEEYAERMADYWDRVIEYMESVVSAIDTLLDKKIDAAEEGKDAAVSALEEEQEASEKYYQDQIDYLDDLIENLEDEKDALQDQIDVIQDQIDALEDANDERERAINLQKAQYALQQAMNQRTKLIYKDGQMVYETDTDAIRDAKEEVEDAEFEITIAALEKQIELLEDQQDAIDKQIEAYEKQQEALQDLLDASNDYYDNLIEETENYWDSLIDSLNAQKDKWDELVEQKEIAEAFATVQEAMEALGFTVDDVLNDTPGAFEAFRDAYLGTLTDANAGNQDFLDGLNYATGGIKDALGTISENAGTTADALSSIGEVTDTVSNAATAIGNVADNTATAAANASTLASNSETLNTNLSGVKDTVSEIAGTDLSSASGSFDALAESIKKVADALGVGDSGTVGSLSKAITDLNAMTLGGEGEGVIGSFNELAKAVGNVTSAINGGGGTETDATEATGTGMNAGSGNETASGLSGAISDLKETADTSIGENADAEEGGTVISDFNALKTAVQTVAEKIGMAGENGEASEDSLIGIIQSLPELAEEALVGESGLKSMFDELLESISACATAATTLLDSINNLGGASTGALAGVAFGNTKATGNVHIGNAYANGKLGIKQAEQAIVGEAGQELIVDSSTGQYRLTHGPELTRLDRGDLVFNAEQTKAIIKNGKTDHGHSYAEGTGTLLPLTDEEMNLFRTMGEALTGIHADTTTMLEPIKSIAQKVTNNTTNIAPVINVTGTQFTVQGVTGEQVSRQISDTFSGIIANAYQRAMS